MLFLFSFGNDARQCCKHKRWGLCVSRDFPWVNFIGDSISRDSSSWFRKCDLFGNGEFISLGKEKNSPELISSLWSPTHRFLEFVEPLDDPQNVRHQIFLMDGKNTFGASRPKMPRSESGWKWGGYDLYSRCFWDSISPWECLIDEIINAFCCAIFVYTALFVWNNCYTYYLRP